MIEKCLTEGAIQAFLDGELEAEELETVTRHIALCDGCAAAAGEAEDETAIAFAALEYEFNALVPTQRLWAKINSSIEEERRSKPVWQKIIAGVSGFAAQLSRPSVAAFASLLLVVGTFSSLWILRSMPDKNFVRARDGSNGAISIAQVPPAAMPSAPSDTGIPDQSEQTFVTEPKDFNKARIIKADIRENRTKRAVNTNIRKNYTNRKNIIEEDQPTAATLQYISGEESYVKTIATLKSAVENNPDLNMKPSARFAIEKDLAVIDDAIKRMQAEIRKNPKNEAARQILFASYQNKIDLLNSVSERNQLIASIR